jgi:hypothetical protein
MELKGYDSDASYVEKAFFFFKNKKTSTVTHSGFSRGKALLE